MTLTLERAAALERALGRPERPLPLDEPLGVLLDRRVLVTGADGSLGTVLVPLLEAAGVDTVATDIDDLDVRHARRLIDADVVFHLAAAKHAGDGETDPEHALIVNALGTLNIVKAAVDGRVVLASTCKAADPETSYGASKLIAERLVLNAGGGVARLYNVVESSGNVFRIWESVPEGTLLPVAPCSRYLISAREAASVLLWAAVLPSGRYTIDPGRPHSIIDVAARVYPDRGRSLMFRRRGDRVLEPLHAECEWTYQPRADLPDLFGIGCPHDP